MTSINDIRKPIAEEMERFEQAFAESLRSDNPLLASVNEYVRQGSGKQLRPILVLLCAKLCGPVSQAAIHSAVALELLHTASLIHDDVVDDTAERRGRKSVNTQWNNKIAILTGDYMLSDSLHHATLTRNLRVLELIANIGMQLSDGELIQLANTEHDRVTEEDYFNVIRKKTALLFSTCTEIGALTTGAGDEALRRLARFGECLGICFQLKDDIFDYDENAHIGKPTCNDLRDGKVTLPLIYALRTAPADRRDRVLQAIRQKDFSPESIHAIVRFAREEGGIAYAEEQMARYRRLALDELAAFPAGAEKAALEAAADFAVTRQK